MMGALGGTAIGALVPHLHLQRSGTEHFWIDLGPSPGGVGGLIGVHGVL